MQLGVFGLNAGAVHGPDAAVRLARLAEELGYDSVWAGEHVVLPSPRVAPAPMGPTDPILDPLIYLSFVAAATATLELGTGIIILPQRNPLVLAKQVASLDVLAAGRLLLGIGVGYLGPEFDAVGVPLADRGRRSDEYVAAMRSLWVDEAPAYSGKYVDFAGVDAYPRPVQPAGPRIIVGGHTAAAHRRAVATGDGWYGFAMKPDGVAEQVAGLKAAADKVERPAGLGKLTISVTPRGSVDDASAAAFAELGVDRLIVYPLPLSSEEQVEAYLRDHARLIGRF